MSAARAWVAFGAALVVVALAAPTAPAATLEYLHVHAGEGSSAGGHAAIRFGDTVYHFQHRGPGLLVPARTDADHFFWVYGVRENRTIRSAAVTIDDATFVRLRDRFNTRFLVERRAAAVLETLARDRTLLEAWAGRDERQPVRVDAAAVFTPELPASSVLERLRATVATRLGSVPFDDLIDDARDAIRRLDVGALVGPVPIDDDGVPDGGYRLSERYADLVARLLALEVLAGAQRVRPEALHVTGDDVPPLGTAERERLAAFGTSLAARLVVLVDSPRPDVGQALLIGMARLQSIAASLESGHLTVVATGSASSPWPALSEADARAYAAEVASAAHRRLRDARLAVLHHDAIDEQGFSRLEDALRDVTSDAQPAVPALASLPRPDVDVDALATALHQAEASEADYRRSLRARLGYGLLDHNCVTEIFRAIDAELTPDESAALLGGHIAARLGTDIVPARSFEIVRDTWSSVRTSETPSYRRRRVSAMCRDEPDTLVRLREGNVLTSTVYRPTGEDSAFLFFTDDAPLVRPLYGLANLVYGAAATGLGVLSAPLDRGTLLRRGAYGVVASVPELAFVSIRKGRMVRGPEPADAE